MQIHLRVGDRTLLFWLFCFLFWALEFKHLLDLFPLSYLWRKNAVRLNVHLEGFSWSSWVREFVMGTNDGFRNFSANCDLERSVSTDRRAGLSWRSPGRPAGGGGAAGARAGSLPPRRPLSLVSPCALHPPPHPAVRNKPREIRLLCPSLRVRERP